MAKRISVSERQPPKKSPAASALIGGTTRDGLVIVSPRDLKPNPYQPRESFPDDTLKELAASIAQDGLIQPLSVRPCGNGKYQIIAGERRWRAAKLAKLRQLPAVINDCSDEDMELLALEENLHREDLNDVDRSRALTSLKDKLDLTWSELAKRVGLSRRRVLMLAGLQNLPEDVQKQIAAGKLTEKHGRALGRLETVKEQLQFAKAVQREELSGDRAIAAARLLQKDGGSIDRAVKAVTKPKAAPTRGTRITRASTAAAQFKEALGTVDPDKLSAAERRRLAADCASVIEATQRLVGQLDKE